MDTPDKETMNTILFFQLVSTFQNAAWQQLGKRVNPITQKIERDFDQASLSIGMLDMLLAKTKGNLAEEEKQFLAQAISDLKLNYVEEVSKAKSEKEPETEPMKDSAGGEASGDKTETESEAAPGDKKEPKVKKASRSGEKKQKKA
jgi:F0F1-type ATP synthase membrane subunit b/b'